MEHLYQSNWNWLDSSGFLPHGHCYLWTPELLWTFVISEAIIVLSYFSIPFALLVFVRRRPGLKFNWMFKLFSLFIFACGATHALGIWTIWHPDYWLDAAVTAFTAAVSAVAALLIWPLLPKAIALPSTQQLEESVSRLQEEVQQRQRAETQLRHLKESSDVRFQAIFSQAGAGFAEIEQDSGRILLINRYFCELLGEDEAHLLAQRFQHYLHPDDLAAVMEQHQALRAMRIPQYCSELRFRHKDGHWVWAALTVSLLHLPEAQQPSYLVSAVDISQRKAEEQERLAQLDELRRWQAVTLDREDRILQLKQEVNALLQAAGQPARYGVSGEQA